MKFSFAQQENTLSSIPEINDGNSWYAVSVHLAAWQRNMEMQRNRKTGICFAGRRTIGRRRQP